MLIKKSIVVRTLILCMLLTTFVQNGLLLSRASAATGDTTTININDTDIGTGVNQFQYVGVWGTSTGVTGNYNSDEHWSNSTKWTKPEDVYFTVKFEGEQIKLYGIKAPNHGIYAVSMDGGTEVEVDAYAATRAYKQLIYDSGNLSSGVHTVKVRATGKKTGTAPDMEIDYAEVTKKIVIPEGPLKGAVGTTDMHYVKENTFKEDYKRIDYAEIITMTEKSWRGNAWKGDRASAQLVLWTGNEAQNHVSLSVGDLVGSNNQRISASQMTANFIRTTKAARGNPSQGKPQELIPDIIYSADPVNMGPSSVQPIWVSIDVPRDAAAGKYTGQITASAASGSQITFNLELEVLDITLPEVKDWDFFLDLWQNPYAVARVNNIPADKLWTKEHFDAMRPHYQMLAEAGQKVITTTVTYDPWNSQTYDPYDTMVKWTKKADGTYTFDFDIFDKWVQFMMDLGIDKQIDAYSMVSWASKIKYYDEAQKKDVIETVNVGTAKWNTMWRAFLEAFVPHLEQKGWLDKTYMANDERGLDAMIQAADLIEEVSDGRLKISAAMNYNSLTDPRLDRIHNISVGLYYVQHDSYQLINAANHRRALGLNTTIYNCVGHYPNSFVRSNPAEPVWVMWYTMRHETDGYLRWAFDSFVKDPFETTDFKTWESGDAFQVYPGTRSSVRFERMKEGIRDSVKVKYISERAGDLGERLSNAMWAMKAVGYATDPYGGVKDPGRVNIPEEVNKLKAVLDQATRELIDRGVPTQVPVTGVTLNRTDAEGFTMDTYEIKAIVNPANASNTKVTWKVADPSIASVEARLRNAKVTALKEGTTKVTVTTEDGKHTADFQLVVHRKEQALGVTKITNAVTGMGVNQFQFVGSGWGHGSDSYNQTVDAYYQVKFNGTQIKFFGGKDPRHGIVAVSIDGGPETEVDLYADTRKSQFYYISPTLLLGEHTVKVRVTGKKNPAAGGGFVAVEYAEIVNRVMIENTAEGTGLNQMTYTGEWAKGEESSSKTAGAAVQMKFSGQQVILVGSKASGNGIAAVSIDGEAEQRIDLYASAPVSGAQWYVSPKLGTGEHTVKVRVTGEKNPIATASNVVLDRMEVVPHDQVAVTGVALNPQSLHLIGIGSSEPLTATVQPESATNRQVTWASADPKIATVDANGVVTAVAQGKTTITVTTTEGKFTASAEVTVEPALPQSIAATLTGPQSVTSGDTLIVKYGLKKVETPVQAQDVTIPYDENRFEYVSAASTLDNVKIVESNTQTPGKIRLIVASTGTEHAIKTEGTFIDLQFRAKQSDQTVSGKITTPGATVSDANGLEKQTLPAEITIQILPKVAPGIPEDVNGDGKVSIGDLSLAAVHYGSNESSPNWNAIKRADVNGDGKIDIEDLAKIAGKIIAGS